MAERKNPQLDAEHQAILRKMMLLAENRTCADCKGPSPRWASTNLGIFICITCSGIHRKLGTHISQVRSITLDTWTPSQIQHFRKFGNAKAADYFEACLPSDFRRPHSADSMQMERFIRDKYENKRYITVENGGLGGQAVGRNRPSRTTQRPSTGSLGPRPTQTLSALHQAAYDATPTVRKTGVSSMSYGGRFSRPVKPMHLPQRTTSTGASFSSSTGSANAMQSASTLKQLLTMGFAQDIAVKAIEAGDGDLQRSLDWILQHDGKPPSQAPAASIIRPRQVQKDLLDFDEPQSSTAASAPAHQPSAPKTMATESLISSTMTDSSTKSMTNSGFADFANFGELQRALPSAVQPKQQSVASHVSVGTPSTPKNAALTSSLASLYKKSPQKPTTAPYHIPSFSKSVSPTHFVASSFQTAGKTTETHANEDSLGLTTFESLSPQNLRLSGKTVPSISLAGKDEQPGVQASQKSVPSCEPPPLPPPDDFLFPDSFGKQPLPSSPKDTSDTRAPPAAKQDIKHEKLEGTNSLSMEKKEESPESEPNVTKNEQKEEEEEDPFAALSMMALNSATKTQQKKEKASTLPKAKASEPRLSQASEGVQSSINLDELLS